MKLIIVESPTKAKTISKFLGKDYTITSSFGHIRDLPKKEMGIDLEHEYTPTYIIPTDKKKKITELKKLAKDAQDIILATDEDREGEAIAWHLAEVLKLDAEKTKRIVFHEITKNAILKALEEPRKIDSHLVDAQQARRVIDRLVGYELSPVLWKKVARGLSAGRVQSVAVRLIVEKERDITSFKPETFFKVQANFFASEKKDVLLESLLSKQLESKDLVLDLFNHCKNATFTISDITVKDAKKSPSAPFTTSTLQQEASQKIGYSVSKTMMMAQKLYENGHITYMRTDSVALSEQAVNQAKQVITSQFGAEYLNTRQFTTKSSSAQEAHEAIRPTDLSKEKVTGGADQQRLYTLILKRTLASQMADAKLKKTTVKIDISDRKEQFQAKGEQMMFDGFLKLYQGKEDQETKNLLPPLEKGQILQYKDMSAKQSFSKPPARFTEASLVKKLEELGIGRPSTYAPTISTVQKRGYIVRETREGKEREYEYITLSDSEIQEEVLNETYGSEKNKLFPTDLAKVVTDFLQEHFEHIMDYGFTAEIEEQFDDIAQGKETWNEVVDDIYKPFHEKVTTQTKEAPRASGQRDLGIDPKSKKPVIVRLGKYGPMAQIGSTEDEEKPQYAKLLPHQSLETITLEEALELFKLPRVVGEFEDKEVKASIGRFGPYVMHDGKFASIKEGDPLSITLDEAIELIKEKREKDANKYIKEFKDEGIEVLNGRYGPYIKKGRKNYKIPKDTDPKELTLGDCQKVIEETDEKKKK